MLDEEAKTLNPTQAELGGEASPPSAASATVADLADNGGKRLQKSTRKQTKNRLKQNAEKSPIIVTHDPKVGAPGPPKRHFKLHGGAQSSKNVKNTY